MEEGEFYRREEGEEGLWNFNSLSFNLFIYSLPSREDNVIFLKTVYRYEELSEIVKGRREV